MALPNQSDHFILHTNQSLINDKTAAFSEIVGLVLFFTRKALLSMMTWIRDSNMNERKNEQMVEIK